MVAYAAQRGLDSASLLAEVGVAPEVLSSPDGRIRRDRMLALWKRMEADLDDPAIAFHVGRAFPFGTFDVLDYVFATSKSVEAGVRTAIRYFRLLIDQAELTLTRGETHATIGYQLLNDADGLARYSTEFTFAVITDRLRGCAALDVWSPLRLRLSHAAHADVSEYEAYFGCAVHFDEEMNELRLPLALLDAPMRRADPKLNTVLRRHASSLLDALPEDVAFDDTVRRELYRALTEGDATPAVEDIAGRLAVGTRTLQRRLKDVDTNFAALLDEMRFNLATRFLGDPSMTIGEVGFLLGFSEPSAFNRAFRRWAGETPGAYRKSALESQS